MGKIVKFICKDNLIYKETLEYLSQFVAEDCENIIISLNTENGEMKFVTSMDVEEDMLSIKGLLQVIQERIG